MNKKIKIIVSSYLNSPYENRINTLNCLIYSLLSQTYKNFKIIIHHDGPLENKDLKRQFENIDPRISFIETEERKNNWGFDIRHKLAVEDDDCEYILFTNDDNYYVPIFLQSMMQIFHDLDTELCYCNLVHNERDYKVIDTYPLIGYIDLGCFITSKRLIKETPWEHNHKEADGVYFQELFKKTDAIKISNILFVHN